jgi:hypothetical protein
VVAADVLAKMDLDQAPHMVVMVENMVVVVALAELVRVQCLQAVVAH